MLFSSTSHLQKQQVMWDYSRNKRKEEEEERRRRKKKKKLDWN